MRLKHFLSVFLTLLTLSVGQMWGADEYEELYNSGSFTSVSTHSYTQNKTFTLNEKGWTASVSQVNGSIFYLGCNSNNASKGILNNNTTFLEVATALASADATYKNNKTTAHAYALLFDNAYNNVTKVVFNWSGGNNAFQVYLFGYTGSAWVKLSNTNYATSGATTAGSVTWTGDATNYTKFAIAARPGATNSTATNKTLRPESFIIYKTKAAPSCSNKVTLATGNPSNGTISFSPTGPVETCDGNVNVTMTITPNAGYYLSAYTTSAGSVSVSNSPSISTGISATAAQTPTLTFAKNANGTYTASATFTALTDHFIDNIQGTSGFTGEGKAKSGDYSASASMAELTLSDGDKTTGSSCRKEHYHFCGWVTADYRDNPHGHLATINGTATGTTYYAVWAKQGAGGSSATVTFSSSSSDGTADVNSSIASYVSSSSGMSSYSGSKVYVGKYGMKVGASSGTCALTCTLSSEISTNTITVDAKKWGTDDNTVSVKINGSTNFGTPQSPSADGGVLTFTADEAATINSVTVTTSTKRAYVKTITVGSAVTYTDSISVCCTELGSINGSVSVTNQTVSWSAVTDASGYKVKVGTGDWSDIGNVTSKTFDLPCGGDTYNVYVMAYNNNNPGHCTGDGPISNAIQVTSAACTEPEIIVDPTSLTGLNYIVGVGPSAAQSFDVLGANLTGDLTVKANDNYEICLTNSATAADWKSGNTTLTIAKATAENGQKVYVRLKSGKTVGDYNSNTIKVYGGGIEEASAATVTVSGSVLKPTITASPTSISGWNAQTGSAPSPATKTITVTGSNLKADISASLTAGGDYFTITPSGLAQSEGSVNGSVIIGVKAATYATAGTYNGTLRLSTTDGDNADVTFSLTVTDDPREKFTLLTSSNLSQLGDDARLVLVYEGVLSNYAAKAGYMSNNGYDEVAEAAATEFEISGNTLYAAEGNHLLILTLGEMENGFSLNDGNKYLSNGTDKKIGNSDDAVAWTIAVDDDGYAVITCTTGQHQIIKYNTNLTSGPYFRAYNASAGNTALVHAYFKASTTPKVNISGTLDAFTYMRDNGPSAAQSFKVRGNNLSANLVVTAPTNYEVCKTENGSYTASVEFEPTAGSVAQTDVYIRLKSGLGINTYNGDITVSSTGATNATKAVTGSVTTPVYTVTLHTNGGTINAGNVTEYTEGVGATLPSDVTKSGNSFEGWFDNEGLSGSAVTTIGTNATGVKAYWAKWQELPGYDITWLVDGEPYTGGEPDVHVVYNGSISKLPSTPTSLDITSKTFVGWTTSAINTKQANAPTPLYTAANQIPGNITENKIFYAVFAQETYSGTFTKVTEASTLAAGNRLLIVYETGNKAAGAFGTGAFLTSQSVTISDNTVTNKGNAVVYVLGGTSSAWTFTSDEGTLACTGDGSAKLALSGGTNTWTITFNSGNAVICNTGYTNYIRYNTDNPRFTTYSSSGSTPQLYREGTSLNDYTTKFVKPIAVTGVTLNKDATTLAIGATETLTATVAPQNATNKNVSWSTSAEGVATVEAGVVTAVAAGEATITVTTEDGSFTDECVVTVLPTVETPTFSPAAGAINKGSKVEISCGTADATILYSLDGSDPSVAYPVGGVTINANCTLKAKATKADYTTSAVAQAAYTIIKATQTVSFTESAISFRLESDEYDAFTGQTASSTYGSASITYASSNTSVAEVDENTGAVTLKGVKGTTTITATAAEDEDYQSASATYTITVLRAGVVRTGDFVLVTNANQLADGDYILLTSETSSYGSTAEVFSGITGSEGSHETKSVANNEITYTQLLAEGNKAKIITLEKVVVDNVDYWAFNYGTESDIYIKGTESTSSSGLYSEEPTTLNPLSDYSLWNISIAYEVATVTNKRNTSRGTLCYNSAGNGYFKAYASMTTNYSLRIYKQKDKNKLPQTLSFATPSYEFPLNESGYTGFAHQTVSGAQTAVTYTSNNASVAAIVENTVVLQGGVGTATITATAAEDDDYEHASATYTITVTAALNTVTFHYYKASDATADQTALKEESSGAGITVPANPANVGEYTFIGWAPATLVETQTAPNNLVAALQAGATYHPATSEEYHAIYRRLENSDGRFYLMHEVSSTPNYAKAPVGTETKSFGNTTSIEDAAVFVQTEDNKLYYDNNGTPRYLSSTSKSARDLDFTTNAADAKVWTITESGLTTTFYSSISEKYFARNGNQYWAAYATSSITQDNQSKDLTKVYLADVYYSSTPNLMVSPVLTWAQGNATHVMEIEATYDNAATATVNDVPVGVTYSSSDPNKATVSNAGVVTAITGGLVTITATVAEDPGVSRQLVETYQVSITKKVPQIVFNDGANWVVYVGEAYKRVLADNVEVTTDGAITYTLSNNATSSDYASINTNTGEVTGLYSNGSAIQAFWVHTEETDMYQAGAANHQFQVWSLKPQTLTFDQAAYAFEMNENVAAFTNTLSGAQTTVTYISDNTDVAEIDSESGEVTVHTNVCGTATITATAAEGQAGELIYREVSQTYTITVNYPKPTFSMESSEIKAPVSLTISGYDEDTKLFWTDGEGEPETLYSEPLAISATKTIRAKATNADGSLVSPIASVTLTKVTPTVVGSQEGGTITLSSDANSLITYIILNQNAVTVAEGENVASPVVFESEMSGTFTVEATATWDVENGFTGEAYDNDFVIKGKGHLPINYTGNGSGLASEDWATIVGSLGNYNNDPKIQFKNEGCGLIAAFVEKPVQLSYQIKHNRATTNTWEDANNVYKVQWSADGDNYYDIKVYNSSNPMSNEITEEQFDLDASARYIKWVYTTKNANIGGNVALGNIQITCEAVVIDGVSVVDIPEDYDGDVVVEAGATWEPKEDDVTEINNLLIKQGAIVDLTDAMLIVNDVMLESMEGYSGQILEPSNFEAQGNAYYDLTLNTSGTMDNSKWYAFAVPFQVDAASGIQRLSNDGKTSNAGFNSHYRIKKYDTAQRLSTGKGWVDVTSGETLYPGHFYMIALNSNVYNRLRMTKKAGMNLSNIGDIDLVTNGASNNYNANWNALANNALAYVNVSASGDNAGIKVQTYRNSTDPDGYDLFDFDEITLTVGTPFFVQAVASAEDGLSVEVATANNETVKAPAREAVATGEFQLRIGADTESYYDKLYVSASDDALNEYQIGHDLQKAGLSTTVPQMYIPAYETKLCDAEFPLVNNEATFPLTFTAPNADTYQLYISKAAADAELYLLKDGAIIWNLTMGAYALELPQGTTENYGLLLKAKAPGSATGIETVSGERIDVQKLIIDEKVFILRGGKMYDVTGKAVK